MIEIRGLSFSYQKGSPKVLDDLSIRFKRGEISILLGMNGAGKSTLFKTIVGILEPKVGEIYLNGENLKSMKRSRRAKLLSYVPQQVEFGSLSVYESVLLGRLSSFLIKPSKEDFEETDAVLKRLHLESFKDRDVTTLSGGEKQKIAIARCLVSHPSFVILDEPTGNLDIKNERILIEIAKQLKEEGVGVILAIHDLNLALNHGDRCYFLKKGRLLYEETPNSVTEKIIEETFELHDIAIKEMEGKKVVL